MTTWNSKTHNWYNVGYHTLRNDFKVTELDIAHVMIEVKAFYKLVLLYKEILFDF